MSEKSSLELERETKEMRWLLNREIRKRRVAEQKLENIKKYLKELMGDKWEKR